MLIHKFVVPITLTLLVSLVMVKCQSFSFKNKNQELSSDEQDGRSIQIELALYNRCSKGSILLEGKKVTAVAGPSFSKLVLTSVGMDSTLTIHSNGTFLCFNKRGRLVNKKRRSKRKSLCQFREILRHSYSTFESVFNPHWYIGFNRTGHPIQGPNVRSRKWKCAMFQKREFRSAPPQPFDKVSQDEWAKYFEAPKAANS
ncbi:fibroblast growth factor 17 [Ixodes scapularis]|uniref:fibroblast growth factor 17 n=1 Tax=Ixodes scapularis TaxID=6945 RepID=UPI001A9CCC99|nr:fibroblast growth factor 17 [Ixodes scapularis]